jgi:hypothetical protein
MPKLAALASAADNICFASSRVRLVYVRGISPHINTDRFVTEFARPSSAPPCLIYVNLMASAFSPSSNMRRNSREASMALTPSGVNFPDHSTREPFPLAACWTRRVAR